MWLLHCGTDLASYALTQALGSNQPKLFSVPQSGCAQAHCCVPVHGLPSAWNTGLLSHPVSKSHLLTAASANNTPLSLIASHRPRGSSATRPLEVPILSNPYTSFLSPTKPRAPVGQGPGPVHLGTPSSVLALSQCLLRSAQEEGTGNSVEEGPEP